MKKTDKNSFGFNGIQIRYRSRRSLLLATLMPLRVVKQFLKLSLYHGVNSDVVNDLEVKKNFQTSIGFE